MTVKSLATGVAAVAAIGAAAAGVTCIASVTAALPQVQPVVFSAPLPLDPVVPGADIPTPDVLVSLLNSLQDPSVPFASKSNLVEGGIGGVGATSPTRSCSRPPPAAVCR